MVSFKLIKIIAFSIISIICLLYIFYTWLQLGLQWFDDDEVMNKINRINDFTGLGPIAKLTTKGKRASVIWVKLSLAVPQGYTMIQHFLDGFTLSIAMMLLIYFRMR